MRKCVAGVVGAIAVLGAGAAIVGAAQSGGESGSTGTADIATRRVAMPDGRSVDVSVDGLGPGTLTLIATSDRAAYFTAMSSEGMDCFIIRVLDAPDGEGRGCDPGKGFAERGSQTLTVIQKDGTRIGGIRSYAPILRATSDGTQIPVSRHVVPYILSAGRSATIRLTTSAGTIATRIP